VPRASEKTEKKAKDRPRPPGPACCGGHDDSDDEGYGARNMTGKPVSYWKGIKWTHVGFLLLLTGGTLLPAVLWVADNVALPSIPIVSTVAMTLGLGATPKLRLEKFYRKHNPEKVSAAGAGVGRPAWHHEMGRPAGCGAALGDPRVLACRRGVGLDAAAKHNNAARLLSPPLALPRSRIATLS